VLDLVPERVVPVVENLATQDVPADPPLVAVAGRAKELVTRHEIVEVGNLEGGVHESGRHPGPLEEK